MCREEGYLMSPPLFVLILYLIPQLAEMVSQLAEIVRHQAAVRRR